MAGCEKIGRELVRISGDYFDTTAAGGARSSSCWTSAAAAGNAMKNCWESADVSTSDGTRAAAASAVNVAAQASPAVEVECWRVVAVAAAAAGSSSSAACAARSAEAARSS